MPEPVSSFIEPFDRTVRFQTETNIVNVQTLGISLAKTDLGEYHHIFSDVKRDILCYYCTESEYFEDEDQQPEDVLMYPQGVRWYCAYDMDGLNTVEDWFHKNSRTTKTRQ